MSKLCSKCCIYDWFQDSNEATRRNAEFYYENHGPMKNESDKDLIQFLPYVAGMHYSERVSDDVRKDAFYIYGKPECIEGIDSEFTGDMCKRELKEWGNMFLENGIDSGALILRIGNILRDHGDSGIHDIIHKRAEERLHAS